MAAGRWHPWGVGGLARWDVGAPMAFWMLGKGSGRFSGGYAHPGLFQSVVMCWYLLRWALLI
jgi:hypothetical protein